MGDKKSLKPRGASPDYRLPKPSRKPSLGQLARIVLVVCVIVQSAAVLPNLLRQLTGYNGKSAQSLTDSLEGPADEWQDNVFPLRKPTPWDISTDFPYPRKLTFTVDEGTWLRLDVHPSSGDVVFDMLGDLYCLPASSYINAGNGPTEAQPVLLGIPFDSDPHFSPDGSKLIFRSDAELGVENIWITNWTSCIDMNIRPSMTETRTELLQALEKVNEEEEMLANGVKETQARRRNRLLREGRTHGLLQVSPKNLQRIDTPQLIG